MDYKKILLPLVLLVLLTVTVSAVSAADIANDTTVSNDASNLAINDVSTVSASQSYNITAGSNTSTIQGVIDNANAGDSIQFAAGDYKDIDQVNITKQLYISGAGNNQTNIYGLGDGNSNSIFNIIAGNTTTPDGTTISGISFHMTQNNASEANDNGYGIYSNSVKDIAISNCSFYNGASGVYFGRCTNCLVTNCYFTGVTEKITHDGNKEKGDKAVNIMGGNNITIQNSVVEGNVLDAISVASNAQYVQVINNYFYNASYGMYFGGGVGYITVKGNTFDSGIADAISLTKSATTTTIINNTFKNLKVNQWGSTVIYSEASNTAHGYPSPIGNRTITNNIFSAAEGQDPAQITAFEIYNKATSLDVTGAITLANNAYNNVTPYKYFQADWEGNSTNGTVIITNPYSNTKLTAENFTETYGDGQNFTATLTDSNGYYVVGQHIALNLSRNGQSKVYWATTDENGQIQLPINLYIGDYTVTYSFAGNTKYNASMGTANIVVKAPENKTVTVLTVNNLTEVYGAAQNLTGTLTANGGALVGQHVAIKLTNSNGQSKVYWRTTDTTGSYQIPIELYAGSYTVNVSYEGTSYYTSSAVDGTITVTNA